MSHYAAHTRISLGIQRNTRRLMLHYKPTLHRSDRHLAPQWAFPCSLFHTQNSSLAAYDSRQRLIRGRKTKAKEIKIFANLGVAGYIIDSLFASDQMSHEC